MMRLLLTVAVLAALLTAAACLRSPPPGRPAGPPPRPAAAAEAPSAGPGQTPAPSRPAWPALDREPELAVRLQRGPSLRVRLLVPHAAPDGIRLPPGSLDIRPVGDGLAVAGRTFGARLELRAEVPGTAFSLDGIACAGRLVLRRAGTQVEAIELVGLEDWLAGVLPAEMHPRWPVAALAAQAIVARSYAAARWQARHGEAWHLLRGTADIAYDGAVPPSREVAAAIATTRGLVLVHGGQAVLARFHACSGGRTEDSAALWPDATLVDGRTPLARFMPGLDDPSSADGAAALGWTRTHERWRVALPRDELGRDLAAWAAAAGGRQRFGEVVRIAVAARAPSGRVARVAVTHRPGHAERTDELDARDFRLAVGANQLRSLWWTSATMAAAKGGQFVVEGRGFGHGVGLPQVSAWWLANRGLAGEDIALRYYPGATLSRQWR